MKSVTVSNSTAAKQFFSRKNQCNMGGKRVIFFYFLFCREKYEKYTQSKCTREIYVFLRGGGG